MFNFSGLRYFFHYPYGGCDVLRKILYQIGANFSEYVDLDPIFLGARGSSEDNVILSKDKAMYSVNLILRKLGYVIICLNGCGCGYKLFDDVIQLQIEDDTFDGYYTILNNVVRSGVIGIDRDRILFEVEKKSAFGVYVRQMIKKLIRDRHIIDQSIIFHGSEFESWNDGLGDLGELWGLPVYDVSMKGQIFTMGNVMVEDERLSPNWFKGLEYDYTIEFFDSTPIKLSFDAYNDKYPIHPVVSLDDLSFSYHDYIQWSSLFKRIFNEGLTLIDPGYGDLAWFMMNDGFSVSLDGNINNIIDNRIEYTGLFNQSNCLFVPSVNKELEFDDIFRKSLGYRQVWMLYSCNIPIYNEGWRIVAQNDKIGLYRYYAMYVDVPNLLIPYWRNVCQRRFIKHMNMSEDYNSKKLKVCMFSISNWVNMNKIDSMLRNWSDSHMILVVPSFEMNDFKNRIEEHGYYDCTFSNLDLYNYDLYVNTIREFDVMLNQYEWMVYDNVHVDLFDKRFDSWVVAYNFGELCDYQNHANSPTNIIKRYSERVRRWLKLDSDGVYKIRFEYLISSTTKSYVKYKRIIDKRFWCLAVRYEDNKKYFDDVSGHMFNLTLITLFGVPNLKLYIAIKNRNNSGKGIDFGFGMLDPRCIDKYSYSEDRSLESDLPWHTKKEDIDGIQSVAYMLTKHEIIYNEDVIKILVKIFSKIYYKKYAVSVPVNHDRGLGYEPITKST